MSVDLMVVDVKTRTAELAGFGSTCKDALSVMFPGLPCSVFQKEDVKEGLRKVDEESGKVFVNDPKEGYPVFFAESLEKLLGEYDAHQSSQEAI